LKSLKDVWVNNSYRELIKILIANPVKEELAEDESNYQEGAVTSECSGIPQSQQIMILG
jgi:hypothetical protein